MAPNEHEVNDGNAGSTSINKLSSSNMTTANDHHQQQQQRQSQAGNKSSLELSDKIASNETNNNNLTKLTQADAAAADTLQEFVVVDVNQARKKLPGANKEREMETPKANNEQQEGEEDKLTDDRSSRPQQNHTVIELANGDSKQQQQQQRSNRTESTDKLESEADEVDEQQKSTTTPSRNSFNQTRNKNNNSNKSEVFVVVETQSNNSTDDNPQDQLGEDLALINKQREEKKEVPGVGNSFTKQANGGTTPLNTSKNFDHQQQQHDETEFTPPAPPSCGKHNTTSTTKARRLSFLQGLLLRKWPYLALTICMMSSLIFGMLLSALTVYTMHFWSDCNGLSALAATAAGHHHHSEGPFEFKSPYPMAAFESEPMVGRFMAGGEPSSAAGLSVNNLEGKNSNATSSGSDANKPRFQRLPRSLMPEHYDLFIWPIIAEPSFEFTGKVAIKFNCRESTNNITLHALDLVLNEKTIQLEQVADESSSNSSSANLKSANQATTAAPKVKQLSQDKQLQYYIIQLDSQLEAGQNYLLTLDFTGYLNDDLAGFYKIKYEQKNATEPTWIAATQFEATDARRAFPCFDEPLFKATFSIKIKHWKNMTALSNMPITQSEQSSDGLWITDSFAKSQRMSTYLVAWAVTNFESRSEGNISVWTRPGFVHTAEYALKIAGKILRHYEDFFGIVYPLPKVDMIALPDFNAGAMENWGLITYRETAMLFDETTSSLGNKQRVAVVVAHELAHQWFGNLVTPKWWDDLWLNEGFASFVEYLGVDHVEPKWQMMDQFVAEEVQDVFKFDALSSTHQISIPVNNPDEISEIFDHISYAKGASIIRMMSHFLTEKVFKSGLRSYLKALKYNNAEQSDLWAHLTEAQRRLSSEQQQQQQQSSSNVSSSVFAADQTSDVVNVEQVMNSWTLQSGYPLVMLNRSYGGQGASTLEQVRYQPYKIIQNTGHGANDSSSTNGLQKLDAKQQKWEIPITYTWKSEQNWQPKTRLWLHQNVSEPVELNSAESRKIQDDEWMLVNIKQVGYYRVNYDERNWNLLIEQLKKDHSKISLTNRAQLLDDVFELAKSSVLDYKLPFEAAKYLRGEQDYLPWVSVLFSFTYIDDMLQRTPIYGQWKDYVADLIEPYYARYKDLDWTVQSTGNSSAGSLKQQLLSAKSSSSNGTNTGVGKPKAGSILSAMDSNDVVEQYNQVNSISWACQVNEHCVERAKFYFKQWKETKQNRINPALRLITYCTAIENGNQDDWDFLWKAYEKEQNASERDRIMRALGCSKEMWILSRYLEWTFDKTKPIRRQDGSSVFRKIANNNYGRDLAFNFMRERWSTIREFYGKTSFSLGHLIRSVSTSMNTQTELDQLRAFYENIKSEVGTGKRSFQLAIEEVESNVLWRNHNYKIIENWLNKERSSRAQ